MMRKNIYEITDEFAYKLMLSDGSIWGFSTTRNLSFWLEEFASIMQFDKSNKDKIDHMFYFLPFMDEAVLDFKKESEGWQFYGNEKVYRIWSNSSIPETFIELNQEFIDHAELKYVDMWSSLKPIFLHYARFGGGPVHSASADLNGKGILIVGPGGAGKSTCSRRLPSYWNSLSDDFSLILRTNNEYRIHPMPTWSDHLWSTKCTTFNTQYSVPLKAIFFLEQSLADEVIPLNKGIAVKSLFECKKQTWHSYLGLVSHEEETRLTKEIFNNSFDIVSKVPCYNLRATIDGAFWEEIERIF